MTSFCMSLRHYVPVIGSRTQRHILPLLLTLVAGGGADVHRKSWISEEAVRGERYLDSIGF